MSHIGKTLILLPTNISISSFRNKMLLCGYYGKIIYNLPTNLQIIKKINLLRINQKKIYKEDSSVYGTARSILTNMISGITKPFLKIIKMVGVGYKFYIKNYLLNMYIGKTENVILSIPTTIKIIIKSPTEIIVVSINKISLGLFSNIIRMSCPVEPYCGRGIFYENEKLLKKIGKRKKIQH